MTEAAIYLDHNATTPLDPRVFEAMRPYFFERFGNAASRQHRMGCEAATAVETARAQVAAVLHTDARSIVFTSGATESDNLAILGVAHSPHYAQKTDPRIVTVRTEHKAVLDPCLHLESRGFEVLRLEVDRDGRLDLDAFDAAVTDRTRLVTIMHANNETGVLHPIAEIGRRCRALGVLLHSDATQSFGKEALDVDAMNVDLLSFSAHKFHGPKGVGGLYLRRRSPRVRCEPLLHGGGHERGLRSGTLNVPGIVGLGEAARIADEERGTEARRLGALRDRLETRLLALDGVERNGSAEQRLAHTTNLSFAGLEGEQILRAVPDLAASSASACTSATLQPSYVLGAMGLDEQRALSSLRLSLGRFTTEEEVDRAADWIVDAVQRLRRAPAR